MLSSSWPSCPTSTTSSTDTVLSGDMTTIEALTKYSPFYVWGFHPNRNLFADGKPAYLEICHAHYSDAHNTIYPTGHSLISNQILPENVMDNDDFENEIRVFVVHKNRTSVRQFWVRKDVIAMLFGAEAVQVVLQYPFLSDVSYALVSDKDPDISYLRVVDCFDEERSFYGDDENDDGDDDGKDDDV